LPARKLHARKYCKISGPGTKQAAAAEYPARCPGLWFRRDCAVLSGFAFKTPSGGSSRGGFPSTISVPMTPAEQAYAKNIQNREHRPWSPRGKTLSIRKVTILNADAVNARLAIRRCPDRHRRILRRSASGCSPRIAQCSLLRRARWRPGAAAAHADDSLSIGCPPAGICNSLRPGHLFTVRYLKIVHNNTIVILDCRHGFSEDLRASLEDILVFCGPCEIRENGRPGYHRLRRFPGRCAGIPKSRCCTCGRRIATSRDASWPSPAIRRITWLSPWNAFGRAKRPERMEIVRL